MIQLKFPLLAVVAAACISSASCRLRDSTVVEYLGTPQLDALVHGIEYADADPESVGNIGLPASSQPFSLANDVPTEYWTMGLSEAVQVALANSKVFRDLGGTVLSSPEQVRSFLDPAVTETDPRFGEAAALSAFDAQFGANGIFQKNDRVFNNRFAGGGATEFTQDLDIFQTQVSKRAATGTEYFLRHNVEFDGNNADANLFKSSWNTDYEVGFRQPLGQGRSIDFNRIAGPDGLPGQLNGVVLARLNTDISLADFQIAVRDLVSNVENSYWELYYAYRDLDVKVEARDRALAVWRSTKAQPDLASDGFEREAQAREQYFRYKEEVQNSLSGRLIPRSGTNRGIAANAFSPQTGVYVAERNLRLLLGLPATDGRLIRPLDEPNLARIIFNWDEVTNRALAGRAELQRQRAQVRRNELAVLATRNFLLPRFDFTGLYRFRGFGHDLISANRGKDRFDNAYADLTTGDFQEWELGMELTFPVGFRQAHAAVRNAQLRLARSRAVMQEQERLIVHDLSNVMAELDRAYEVLQTSLNRRQAANDQLESMEVRERAGITVDMNLLLDAQRRKADADQGFFRSLSEYALAIKNVHYSKGTLLAYHNIVLAEMSASPALGNSAVDAQAIVPMQQYYSESPEVISNPDDGPVDDAKGIDPAETLPAPEQTPAREANIPSRPPTTPMEQPNGRPAMETLPPPEFDASSTQIEPLTAVPVPPHTMLPTRPANRDASLRSSDETSSDDLHDEPIAEPMASLVRPLENRNPQPAWTPPPDPRPTVRPEPQQQRTTNPAPQAEPAGKRPLEGPRAAPLPRSLDMSQKQFDAFSIPEGVIEIEPVMFLIAPDEAE